MSDDSEATSEEWRWDPEKAAENRRKHRVGFAEAVIAQMKREYDFSKAQRGAVIREGLSKERITIRLDRPILDWFRRRVEAQGFGNYQTLINSVLRDHVENQDRSRYREHEPGRPLEVREGIDASSLEVEVRLLSRRVTELEKRSRPGPASRRRDRS